MSAHSLLRGFVGLSLVVASFVAIGQHRVFPESEWRDWLNGFVAEVDREARVTLEQPRGSVAGERTAMAIARKVWAEHLGREIAESARPYRAFRRNNLWIVTGTDGIERPGDGPVLVLTRDAGAVVLIRPPLDGDQAAMAQGAVEE
jgi:hypothetical protein